MFADIAKVGDWTKDRLLGSGGFGQVVLWTNKQTGQSVALKILKFDGPSRIRPLVIERWTKEVDIMERLSHPNVVKAFPVPPELASLSPHQPSLCMEYCEQGDLRKLMNRAENSSGFPEIVLRKVLQNIKDAVEYLHKERITHRDLKPENIVIKEENNQISFKLIDLGYAKEWDQNSLCSTFVGTLQYVAPELFTQNYTSSVDYWSFGLVCHEIITGYRPFLPNMTPYSWIPLVKKKTFEDICIYQNEDETIEYCQQLSPYNHISQSLRCSMEDWLRFALEWDGSRRGLTDDGELIIFSLLQDILDKKIVTIFSFVTVERLSYEVDGSTAVSTLKDWIKRDTRLPVKDQYLLLPTGHPIPDDALTETFWQPDNEIAMVYLFHKNSLEIIYSLPKIPPLVKEMMEKPKTPHIYYFLKKMWAQSVYFLQRETFMCQAVMESHAVLLLSLMNLNQKVITLDQEVNNDFQQALAYLKLYTDSVEYDSKCWRSINPNNSGLSGPNKWKTEEQQHIKDMNQLRSIGQRLGLNISSIASRLSKLQLFADNFQNPVEELNKLLDTAYRLYTDLQKKPKELRNNKAEFQDLSMSKVIKSSITVREEFLKDQTLHSHLEEIKRCEIDVLSLFGPLRSYQQHLIKVKRNLRKSQLEKQKSIWQLFLDTKKGITGPGEIKTKASGPNEEVHSKVMNTISRSQSFTNHTRPPLQRFDNLGLRSRPTSQIELNQTSREFINS